MLGTIIGDIAGSVYEFKKELAPDNLTLEQMLKDPKAKFTDDTVLTIAVADAVSNCFGDDHDIFEITKASITNWVKKYPHAGYGGMFYKNWVLPTGKKEPIYSYGNGAAMRISPVGWLDIDDQGRDVIVDCVTAVSHTHPSAIFGAQIVAHAIHLGIYGSNKEEIMNTIADSYGMEEILTTDVKDISTPDNKNINCIKAVKQALIAVNCATSFEDAILKAIYIGGDTDTIAAIAGGIAEVVYQGEAKDYIEIMAEKIPDEFFDVMDKFYIPQ